MRLRHATVVRFLPSIERGGLKCSKSRGKKRAIWLHTPAASWWAVLHTVERHGGRVEAVVILEVSVPRSWLRHYRPGLWYSVEDIPPDRFKRVITFHEFAGALAQT